MVMVNYSAKTQALRVFLSRLPETGGGECHETRNFPRISIVMPSYNQARYIERSILSVLNQGYPNLEFIIVDGGSTDGSVEIIKKYSRHIAYWHSGPDAGQSDALNHGFSKATGEIVGWMNSDDLYLPGTFESVVGTFRANREAGILFGDWWEIDSDDKVTNLYYAFDFNLRHFIYEGFHLNSQAMFLRREVYRRFGEFDVKLHRTMDYDFILRLGLTEGQAAFTRISQPLACFRRHEEQKTMGFDHIVDDEHRRIASKNGVDTKYSLLGTLLRPIYRFRRAYWYVKRGGLGYAFTRAVGSRAER